MNLKSHSILLLSNSSNLGGGERSLLLIAQGLIRRNWKVHVAVPASGRMTAELTAAEIPHTVVPYALHSWKKPFRFLLDLRRWSRIFKGISCDLIHANDISTARSLAYSARQFRLPLLCHIRYPPESSYVDWAFRGVPRPNAFVFNSHAMKAELGSLIMSACPRVRQIVLHNAVDTENFHPPSQDTHNDRPIVAILANLVPVKGHDDFLAMAMHLCQRGYKCRYWIIGEDVFRTGADQQLRQKAAELGIGSHVEFLGHVRDVPNTLRRIDILVCPSTVETFGRCLIEAMACGKPVVATRVGGIPEVVDDSVTGILVAPREPRQLADAVESLLTDRDRSEEMGRAGRRSVVANFSEQVHVDKLITIYEQFLGGRCLPSNGDECESTSMST
ncbi:GDP-mannose-dependent alpha-(1-6)-phosphatidylinositol monomannoside mannosyltransferase [Novipirellula galeiformis]|uniref:GDP-mannose-dependent alpha-(1-6)-phosphatidylinositol monomannoside mannosyltransferase n=1 Tax=Novipirellula galeiformis TaxID=2528004 RepID=A0A5C6C930_9BACT|nr:glycosyltransferase family 4 protein [Novipirellula galeiformis]TWU21213.1 GDP-mannose-dependent alpha-(1-6)-phosphatidylinositol monomannoside mannosyltransferase [Novipirellula galeiformis]